MDSTEYPTGAPPAAGYLDAASAEPLHPAAREVWLAAIDDGWADPARLYGAARRARMLLDNAREVVAAVLGARPDEVSFTGSGTQAVHLGMLGTLAAARPAARTVVVSAVEHSSVLHAADFHAGHSGAHVARIPVDHHGAVDPAAMLEAAAGTKTAGTRTATATTEAPTALVALQSANHEVGTVQPVEEVAAACDELGVALFVDAAQSIGRLTVPPGWSVLTGSAHKWGGPPGVGVLGIRRALRWRSPLPEDERESGRVPGFGNLPGVLAAAAALHARVSEADEVNRRQSALIERIRRDVAGSVPDVEVVGHPDIRLPHLVTFSCLYVNGEALVTALDRAGFAVSSGSSCTASTLRPSHVLEAMGAVTHGNVRLSLTRDAREADVDRFLGTLPGIVADLRREAGM